MSSALAPLDPCAANPGVGSHSHGVVFYRFGVINGTPTIYMYNKPNAWRPGVCTAIVMSVPKVHNVQNVHI